MDLMEYVPASITHLFYTSLLQARNMSVLTCVTWLKVMDVRFFLFGLFLLVTLSWSMTSEC